jgi:hypothetical protein
MVERDLRLDLLRAFAIIAIMLWHFGVIPTWSFIWAIPSFIFVTSSAYCNRLEEIKLKKIILNFVWIFGIIIFFTFIARFLDIPKILNTDLQGSITSIITYFIIRNPYLGNLWYFLIYFQLLFLLYILGKMNQKTLKRISRPIFFIIILIISLAFSYYLLYTFNKGITLNIISWLPLVWLGTYYYKPISDHFKEQKKLSLSLYFLIGSLAIFIILYLGNKSLNSFLQERTHDFIFPTNLMQVSYILIFFCITEIMMRYFPDILNSSFKMVGVYSMYIYIFHLIIYRILLNLSFGKIGIILTLITCLILGFLLEKTRLILFKYSYYQKLIYNAHTNVKL